VNEHEVEIGANAIDDLTTAFQVLVRLRYPRSEQSTSGRGRRDRTASISGSSSSETLVGRRGMPRSRRHLAARPRRPKQRRSSGLSQRVVDRSARDVDKVFEPRVAGSDRGKLNDAFGRRTTVY
jgi:hypothetical protein